MSQKNYPLHKIIIASQNRPPWVREDPDSPIWPRSALDTGQIMPLRGGARSFWSCYNCSNYDQVRTQDCRPDAVWFAWENRCVLQSFPFLNLYPFSGWIFSCFFNKQVTWPASCKYRNRFSIYNNNFKIKHFHAREDMNLNEFADFGSKNIYLIYKTYQRFQNIEHIQFTQSTYLNFTQ